MDSELLVYGYVYGYETLGFRALGRLGKEPVSIDRINPPSIWETRTDDSISLSKPSFSK